MIRARSEKYKRMMLELGHCCEGKTEERTELELEVKPQGVGTQESGGWECEVGSKKSSSLKIRNGSGGSYKQQQQRREYTICSL